MKRIILFLITFAVLIGLGTTASADLILPRLKGSLMQGGIVRGNLPPGFELELDGKEIPLNAKGQFVFGFGRDAKAEMLLRWRASGGSWSEKILKITPRDYPTQYVEGVPQATVTPSEDKLARIRKETAAVKRARAELHLLDYFDAPFIVPLDGPITGVYGSQRVYNGVPKRPHFGVDYAAPEGTPVVAPADAMVTLAHDNMYYSGGTLIMDHGYGLSSTFIHLSEVTVEEGKFVKQGQVVGKVGAGGRATGPHLDWRLNWHEVRLDPLLIFEASDLGTQLFISP